MLTHLTCPTMCAFAFCGTTFPAQQLPHEVFFDKEILHRMRMYRAGSHLIFISDDQDRIICQRPGRVSPQCSPNPQ